jgi:hypothetical protein
MNTDDSIFLTELTKRVNDRLINGEKFEEIDLIEIENELIHDTKIVPAGLHSNIKKQSRRIRRSRLHTASQVQRKIADEWKTALNLLDKFMATADAINNRLVKVVFANGDILRSKEPRPIPDALTGGWLKCLNMLALYGKSCRIATEISYLLRTGFPDGATARFRTLYEHLVIMMILHNDTTYELNEGYQDSAIFEFLKQRRTEQSSFADSFWYGSEGFFEDLARDIHDLEAAADEVIARRGPRIKRQYEWARPALPEPKKNNLNYMIKFTDLEAAATGTDFLRTYYLRGNDRIHAGAYGVINHFDFDDPAISLTQQYRDDFTTHSIGCGVPTLMGWAARAACKSIAWETEEYDEILYVCELIHIQDATVEAFIKGRTRISSASRRHSTAS